MSGIVGRNYLSTKCFRNWSVQIRAAVSCVSILTLSIYMIVTVPWIRHGLNCILFASLCFRRVSYTEVHALYWACINSNKLTYIFTRTRKQNVVYFECAVLMVYVRNLFKQQVQLITALKCFTISVSMYFVSILSSLCLYSIHSE